MNKSATTRVRKYPSLLALFLSLFISLILASCESKPFFTDLRIYSSPYADVDWPNVIRLKAQHHEHVGTNAAVITAYDEAGYDVLSLMDYSGNASLSYARRDRLWPPDNWITNSVLSSLDSIQFFIPNAEEVGINQHATSPFLTTYIEGVPATASSSGDSQYGSLDEMFTLIRKFDGFPCLAHPWDLAYQDLQGTYCAEIYSAFAEARRSQGVSGFVRTNRNDRLLEYWDTALRRNQKVFGIAVNDHFGPHVISVAPEIRDSGKIEVLALEVTAESYREAFENGRFFAIRDTDVEKDHYPTVFSIAVDETSLFIEANGIVRWTSDGISFITGPELQRTELTPNATYVRAEISAEGSSSVTYSQAFVVRPVGDVDGDYDIDSQDEAICVNVSDGVNTNALQVAACGARDEKQTN